MSQLHCIFVCIQPNQLLDLPSPSIWLSSLSFQFSSLSSDPLSVLVWGLMILQSTMTLAFNGYLFISAILIFPSLKLTVSKVTNLKLVGMGQDFIDGDLSENEVNVDDPLRNTKNEAENKCNQCDFTSSQAGDFRRHLKTHSREKSNKYNQCGYASLNTSNLRKHLKTHSRENPNKCNQCNFASSQASNLRAHLKIHSGEKSNKCSQCDFASSRAGNLKRHLKTHSGEKSNKCNQCDFASFYASSLERHFKAHNGEKSN